MSRLKGGLIETIFDVSKRAPLDARELVTKYEDLINPSVWIITGTNSETLYDGLTVSVREAGPNMGKYFLIDRKAITQENYNAYLAAKDSEDISSFFSMWRKFSTTEDLLELAKELQNTLVGAKIDETNLEIVDRQLVIPRDVIVKGTEEISVSEAGDLSINQLDVGKLTQREEIKLVLNGGDANG